MMNKQEILRQLQSRIDKRSNDITELERYLTACSAMQFADEYEREYQFLSEMREDQTLDKRIIGELILNDRLFSVFINNAIDGINNE